MADPQLEKYFDKPGPWQSSLNTLRKLVLKTELKEERKWGMPTYTYDGKPIVGISGFKNSLRFMVFPWSFTLRSTQNTHQCTRRKNPGHETIAFYS